MHHTLRRTAPVVAFALLVACDGEPSRVPGEELEAGTEPKSPDLIGAGGETDTIPNESSACEHQELEAPETSQLFRRLTASLIEHGLPAAVQQVQICSFDKCLMGGAASSGEVEFEQPEDIDMIGPALKVGNGVEHATLAYRLPQRTNHALDPLEVISLPFSFEGELLDAGTGAESAGVALFVPKDATLDFDRLVYPNEEDQTFRAGLRADLVHPSFPEEDTLVVALAPEATEICPAADLTVPNAKDWEPKSAVKLSLHGTKLQQKHAPYGGFGDAVVGTVSDDGSTIFFEGAVRSLGVYLLQLKDSGSD